MDLSQENLKTVFSQLGIKRDDLVFLVAEDLKSLHLSQQLLFIENLSTYLGSEGTILMSFGGYNQDPSIVDFNFKFNDFKRVRQTMPAYSLKFGHLYSKDPLAKALLLKKDVVVSDHATYPYLALGKYGKLLCQGQSLNFPNGSNSPLAKLYQLRGKMLLINSSEKNLDLNTYLFEQSYKSVIRINGSKILKNNKLVWQKFLERMVDQEKLKKISNTKAYKQVFYQKRLENIKLSACCIRDYIDYCRQYL